MVVDVSSFQIALNIFFNSVRVFFVVFGYFYLAIFWITF